jgi:hypothetical protein
MGSQLSALVTTSSARNEELCRGLSSHQCCSIVYLEEALNSSAKLSEMRKRSDLLAFADDMLILTNCRAELVEAIQ